MFHQDGQSLLFETIVVGIHHVEWHLDAVKGEVMSERRLEHLIVNLRTFVAGESDVADFPLLFGFEHRFHSAASGKDSLRVSVADHLMKLQQIDMVGLKTTQ